VAQSFRVVGGSGSTLVTPLSHAYLPRMNNQTFASTKGDPRMDRIVDYRERVSANAHPPERHS